MDETPHRRWPKVAAAAGLAAGAAVGAAVLTAAAGPGAQDAITTASPGSSDSGSSGTGSGSASPSTPQFPGPGDLPGGPHPGFPGGPGFLGGGVLHGEFTVNGPNGYETLQVQNGTVSSITNTSGSTWSLVVKSADGTSLTYVVDSSTSVDGGETGVSSIATGDTVHVIAVVANGTAAAKQVGDETVLQNNGAQWLPPRPTPPGSPSPSSSGSGTSGSGTSA